jgi:hypothetical protein
VHELAPTNDFLRVLMPDALIAKQASDIDTKLQLLTLLGILKTINPYGPRIVNSTLREVVHKWLKFTGSFLLISIAFYTVRDGHSMRQ